MSLHHPDQDPDPDPDPDPVPAPSGTPSGAPSGTRPGAPGTGGRRRRPRALIVCLVAGLVSAVAAGVVAGGVPAGFPGTGSQRLTGQTLAAELAWRTGTMAKDCAYDAETQTATVRMRLLARTTGPVRMKVAGGVWPTGAPAGGPNEEFMAVTHVRVDGEARRPVEVQVAVPAALWDPDTSTCFLTLPDRNTP